MLIFRGGTIEEEEAHFYKKLVDMGNQIELGSTLVHDVLLGIERKLGLEDALQLEPSALNEVDKYGTTPLHWACWKKDINAMRVLLRWKADTEKVDLELNTPLVIAAFKSSSECVQGLLDAGANVRATNKFKWTPLHLACWSQSVEVVQILLHRGADPSAANIYGQMPVHMPSESGYHEDESILIAMIQALIRAGCNLEDRDIQGNTPLLAAVSKNHNPMMRALCNLHSDIGSRDNRGWTILHFAAFSGSLETFQTLKQTNLGSVDPELADVLGRTATDIFFQRLRSTDTERLGQQTIPTEQEEKAFHDMMSQARAQHHSKSLPNKHSRSHSVATIKTSGTGLIATQLGSTTPNMPGLWPED